MNKDTKIFIILDNIRSLLNVGSIFRLADAAGEVEIYLCGISGVEKIGNRVGLNPRLEKTALEGFNSVTWKYFDTSFKAIKELKDRGVKVVAIELDTKSKNYLHVRYELPIALLVGHERDGVSDQILKVVDEVVEIPMHGKGKSLNVATSLAVVLYEVLRQT